MSLAFAVYAATQLDPGIAAIAAAWLGAIGAVGSSLAAVWARGARSELRTNGGSSTKDLVLGLHTRMDGFDRRLTSVEAAAKAPVALVEPVGEVAPIIDPTSKEDT